MQGRAKAKCECAEMKEQGRTEQGPQLCFHPPPHLTNARESSLCQLRAVAEAHAASLQAAEADVGSSRSLAASGSVCHWA